MVKRAFADNRLLGRHGLSMVEALVALMVLTIISSAIVLLSLQVLALTYSSRLKNQAVTYAEQMVEQVRNYYQANSWGMLSNFGKNPPRCFTNVWATEILPGSTCVTDSNNPQCNISQLALSGTPFYRYLLVTTSGASFVQVSVVVTWKERGVCKPKTQIDTYYYNY